MTNDLVSVIMPSYCSEHFIAEAIESVIAQSYPHWELIVIDDASEDRSREIVTAYMQKDDRIKLIVLAQNSGAAVARNRGIEAAQGRYIAFLDSDDIWKPQKLQMQIKHMRQYRQAFTYSAYHIMDRDSNHKTVFEVPENITYRSMLKTCSVGCLTAIYDTEILGKCYMPDIRKRQDYALWLSILKRINEAKGIMEPLASYRVVPGSVSSDKLKAARFQWRVYRDVEKMGWISSAYYFVFYALHGILKHYTKYTARGKIK